MRYFDLHCDTLYECFIKDKPLKDNDLHVSLEKAKVFDTYVQCCAVWLSDDLRGETAFSRFCGVADRFEKEISENADIIESCRKSGDLERTEAAKKHGAVLTVESGAALGGKFENIEEFVKRGVRMCTLTWNGETELGCGVMSEGDTGISDFGRQAVKRFEEVGILTDISHASPELFWDIAEISTKPIVASHSNSKKLCSHPRNLTDEQFAAIKASGGLVGLNFYEAFLNNEPEKVSMEDVLRHAEHFLSLGGEDILAMGGDWDGAKLPRDMESGLSSIPELYELFLRHNYSEKLLDKIFYSNAARLFKEQKLI